LGERGTAEEGIAEKGNKKKRERRKVIGLELKKAKPAPNSDEKERAGDLRNENAGEGGLLKKNVKKKSVHDR